MDSLENLTHLGSKVTEYSYDSPDCNLLQVFPNQYRENPYEIYITFPEFTSLCPKTGQPDFATISIKYVPITKCIETKSFKLYMLSFRNFGGFMETITNKIMEDLYLACRPQFIRVKAIFNVRGGTSLTVLVERDIA